MCGIAGAMTRDGGRVDMSLLARMAGALAHRGPDGEGTWRDDDVGLVHRRLAIIDLKTGDQPLFADTGQALIVNGEIYNDPDLRRGLAGYPFRTGSDCEPILPLYQADGLDFAKALRGMYALALHDPARRRLVLARDPFGIKPLYFAETASIFLFASEAKAILATGLLPRQISDTARDELLQLQFTTGGDTIFPGIHRLLPGETIVVEGGRVVERRRLPALPADGTDRRTDADAGRELDRVLTETVLVHQRADVPFGMFLSGGIDSASLLALMARLNEQPVIAFTATFPGTNAADESAHARALARTVGARHQDVPVGPEDFWTLLPSIAQAMDDPAADYAVLPTYKLAAVARQSVKVVLSGEGGDEMFAGYGRYRAATRPWPFARRMRRRGLLDGVLREDGGAWRAGYRRAEIEAATRMPGSRLRAAQALDCADWLPNDLLNKLDRCLMAHGLEGRVPFLDPEVARFALRLADRQKMRHGLGKWLLRDWLSTALPDAKPFSRKRGFTVPVEEWLAARPKLGPLLAARPCIAAACRDGAVTALFARADKRSGRAAWTLLFYALWHRCHIEGRAPEGDVFDCLSNRD
jgi:asparagine synthase (glutamine-hydrolysing)